MWIASTGLDAREYRKLRESGCGAENPGLRMTGAWIWGEDGDKGFVAGRGASRAESPFGVAFYGTRKQAAEK